MKSVEIAILVVLLMIFVACNGADNILDDSQDIESAPTDGEVIYGEDIVEPYRIHPTLPGIDAEEILGLESGESETLNEEEAMKVEVIINGERAEETASGAAEEAFREVPINLADLEGDLRNIAEALAGAGWMTYTVVMAEENYYGYNKEDILDSMQLITNGEVAGRIGTQKVIIIKTKNLLEENATPETLDSREIIKRYRDGTVLITDGYAAELAVGYIEDILNLAE
jgi:hypothetical protein